MDRMLATMTVDEIMHWLGELTSELARRADQPAQPAAPSPPWAAQAPAAPEPPRWAPPRQEPKARPFTQTAMPVSMAAMPAGGLPPGTPLTPPSPATSVVDPTVAALIAQLQAQMAGQQTSTPTPRAPGIVTTTAKTDPETARVFLGVPARPEGSPPINGAGVAAGGAIVEPA